MGKGRLEAFSDGVIAVIITIMVLGDEAAARGGAFRAGQPLLPVFVSYVLSFIYVGIYWNNHHHLMHAVHKVDGRVMWANLHLLFWLSLFPFMTGWMGENHFDTVPVALYGAVLFMAAIAYTILVRTLIALHGNELDDRGGDRQRHEGLHLAGALSRGDRDRVLEQLCGVCVLHSGGRDLAYSRPADRADN